MHGSIGAVAPGMIGQHHNSDFPRGRHQAETVSPNTTGPSDRVEFGQANPEANGSHRAHRHDDHDDSQRIAGLRGNARQRFNDVVGAAVFAHRVHMEARAEIRDLRIEIRGLMGEVDGGQLTPQQQETFDKLVGKIVDLRNANDSRGRRPADADEISARILKRFGVEAAPREVVETTDKGIAMQAPDYTRTVTTHSTAVPGDTGIAIEAPDYTQVFTTHSPAAPEDKGIAMKAPDYARLFTVLPQQLLDRMA